MRLVDADALCDAINKSMLVLEPREVSLLNEIITNAPTVQREGWVSVPIEPDMKMIIRAIRTKENMDNYSWIEIFTECYKSMIQAAPTDME